MAKSKIRQGGRRAPAIQAKAKRMVEKLHEHYHLGQEANLAAKTNRTSTKDFADSHGMNEHTMRKIRRFASEYSRRDLVALREPRPNGLPLQWGHINYLLTIPDKSRRLAIQQRAIEEGWTAPQLNAAIHAKRPAKGHGRPMKKPATPEAGLQQLMAEATMWIRRCEVVMLEVGREAAKKPGRGLRRRAEEAVEVLAKVGKAAKGAAGELQKLLAR